VEVHLRQLDLVVVGAPAADFRPLLADYERRLSTFCQFAVHEVKVEPLQRGHQGSSKAEAERIIGVLERLERSRAARPFLIVCEVDGKAMSTETFAERVMGQPSVALVVGGAAGLDSEVRKRADLALSLGGLTFPHQLARLVLTEQLYRASKIARGEPYHH
jgi:23S rRNA (pseudouridine1915-N3)-methyltransferase